jgi:cell wall-associated NlpC family hydrolase
MTRVRSTHGVVTLPVLDVRPKPAHAAELVSQLLLGETVELLAASRDGGWLRVRNEADGYAGWVRAWGVVQATAARVARWRRLARGRIGVPMALVVAARATKGKATPANGAVVAGVSPVFFGGRLIAARPARGWCAVELPDGRRGYLPSTALAGSRPPALEQRVAALLGSPYLWGGRSPAGYDCSAFVQQVLLEQGIRLPRDAKDQCRASRPVSGPERRGDLAFFRRPGEPASHVGIALGGGYFTHCRGRVVIASVDNDNPLYDKELKPQFMGWYRPRPD